MNISPIRLASLFAVFIAHPHASAAIYTFDPPSGFHIGTPVSHDFDTDGIDDVTARYHSISCRGETVIVCTVGLEFEFGPSVRVLGTLAGGEIIPTSVSPGSILGPSITAGSWTASSGEAIELIYYFGTVSWANGYPDYAAGMERLFVSLEFDGPSGSRYGYIDVQLATGPIPNGGFTTPTINGLYLGDQAGQPVTVTPIPEPCAPLLVTLSVFGVLRSRRRTNSGQQVVGGKRSGG